MVVGARCAIHGGGAGALALERAGGDVGARATHPHLVRVWRECQQNQLMELVRIAEDDLFNKHSESMNVSVRIMLRHNFRCYALTLYSEVKQVGQYIIMDIRGHCFVANNKCNTTHTNIIKKMSNCDQQYVTRREELLFKTCN